MQGEPATRVALVDDHAVVRRGLRLLLEQDLEMDVSEGATAEDAVALACDPSTDILLVDFRLGSRNALWAIERIRKERPDVPVLVLSTYANSEQVEGAIDAGANGYLLKEATVDQLREAVASAMAGDGFYLHPAVAHLVLARRASGDPKLTDREQHVLELLVGGATNQQISQALSLSEKTVKSHLSSVFRKLAVANRTQAVAKALRGGIVEVQHPDER